MTTLPLSGDQTRVRRYPGVLSFDDDDAHRLLFRGRDAETYELLQLILGERLVVLFARSGVGKSSIINAGLMQPLRDKGFFPMVVRVSSVKNDPIDSLYRGVLAACDQAEKNGEIEAYEPKDPDNWNRTSLWHFFKSFYIWRGESELLRPVVIIDQFEELFTLLSSEQRKPFINELADLVRGIHTGDLPAARKDSESELGDHLPDVKIVLVIREDSMAGLEEMAERIPSILKARFRLGPLETEQAKLAIVEPAALKGPEFETQPFSWSDKALQSTLDFLRKRKASDGGTEMGHEVEPFQLQLVCQFVEDMVQEKNLTTISDADLGGDEALQDIMRHFYQQTIDEICDKATIAMARRFRLRRRLRNFCEHGLITATGRRLLREESTIHKEDRISTKILSEMVERRLIRKEPRVGDNYYELTHDTLIDPILKSRRRLEQRVRKVVIALGLVAIAVGIWAGFNGIRQEQRVNDARRATQLAVYGEEWGNRENYELAILFFNIANTYDNASNYNDTILVSLSMGDAQRRIASVRRSDADLRVATAIRRAEGIVAEPAVADSAINTWNERLIDEIDFLVDTGSQLAAGRFVQQAIDVYDKAQDLIGRLKVPDGAVERIDDDRLDSDQIAAPPRDLMKELLEVELSHADLLAKATYIEAAVELYEHVKTRHAAAYESRSRTSWHNVCWRGSLFRLTDPFDPTDPADSAIVAMIEEACDEAVAAAREEFGGNYGPYHDSRGLFRALTNDDNRAAISDFEEYIIWGESRRNGELRREKRLTDRRRRWNDELRAGRNPFENEAMINALKRDIKNSIQNARLSLFDEAYQASDYEPSLSLLLEEWSLNPIMLDLLQASGSRLSGCDIDSVARCDSLWATGELVGMDIMQSNPCSEELVELAKSFILGEVFITDSQGFNVCMSQATTDYYQADEDWWRDARDWPRPRTRRSESAYDDSAEADALSVYVAIRDPRSEKFLGVIKAVFRWDLLN